jgi:hypothetical protein
VSLGLEGDRGHKLPVARQAKLVGISRSSAYYVPRPVRDAHLNLMRRIDELEIAVCRSLVTFCNITPFSSASLLPARGTRPFGDSVSITYVNLKLFGSLFKQFSSSVAFPRVIREYFIN